MKTLESTKSISSNKVRLEFDTKKIDAIFAELDQCHLPGAAVGIAIGGRPVYRKGFGLASMELPVLLSPSIRMRIGSTTKHFTCLAYMLLCEEGKAGIDDPVEKYLPELHPVAHKIRMRHLMGNISGLRDVHDVNWHFSGTGRPVSSADVLALYRSIDDVNFAPGTAWCYNNGGFSILTAAIERITGQSLEEILRQRIFEPVGMHDTMLRRLDTDFVPNSATLHMTNPAGGFEKSYLGVAPDGKGGMVSTVDDMLRWLAHMDAPFVGSPATWSAMKTPQVLANGTSTGYGLGLMTGFHRGVETLSHAGGVMGGNSQMLKVPSVGLDIAIMLNRHDVSGTLLVNKILDACLSGLDPVRENSSVPSAAGIFHSPATGRVIQLFAKDGQQIASIDGMEIPFVPGDDGTLQPDGLFGYIKQTVTLIGDPAEPASIRFNNFGNLDELVRVQPADKSDLSAIAGRYRSEASGTDATICQTESGPRLRTAGRFGSTEFTLEYRADGIWQAKSTDAMPWGGILLFGGDPKGFRMSTMRTWGLPFRQVN